MEDENRPESFVNLPLFVYGTLRKGFRAHELLRRLHAQFLARGQVRGRLYDLGEYPGATEGASDADRVHGEVYLLPDSERALNLLDKFEGFDPDRPESGLFLRERTTVTLASGRRMPAWIYRLREARGKKRWLPSGEYEQGES
ncbi:MAG: gamma-glutamylcyclotransferase [Acidobacteria bacterium]|nr:gamma-glutamylcyclotransferase [Acidobacteriota bacterium]